MYVAAPAKINLGLHINNQLDTGYHTIESVFLPINWFDFVESLPSSADTQLSVTGRDLGCSNEDNLIIRLLHYLKREGLLYEDKEFHIYLHKQIPIGAGLGGGSSDVMSMLRLLEMMGEIKLNQVKKKNIANTMGSDCCFFIDFIPSIVTGIGNEVDHISFSVLDNNKLGILLVEPPLQISSSWAYRICNPYEGKQRKSLKELIQEPISVWKNSIHNDFETYVFNHYPILSEIKNKLYESGAIYASMSGSGSVLYGFFPLDRLYSTGDIEETIISKMPISKELNYKRCNLYV